MVSQRTEIKDPRITEIVRRLVEALQPTRIYLFGSRARGEAREESDYDILVLVRSPQEDLGAKRQAAYDAIWGIGVLADVVVMSEEFFLRRRIVLASLPGTVEREGRLLYVA
jgi:uncharacterized protein